MSADHADQLDILARLSQEFGGPDYVKGGGGNTSVKSSDTLWIKPSGTELRSMQANRFVAMDRHQLSRLYAYTPSPEATVREREVQELMMAARRPGETGRPSVETPLHDLLDGTYVVHTHAVLVNGLTCARQGAARAAHLFPEALWVPYIDPGYTLSMEIRTRVAEYAKARGHQPSVILLENHGIFVSGATPADIREHYRRVLEILGAEYARAGVATTLRYGTPTLSGEVPAMAEQLQNLLGEDGACLEASAPFAVVPGPLSPDHMVYAKAQPFTGELTARAVADFRERWGYPPRIVANRVGVFGIGRTPRAAQLALELARDGALVQQLTAAFGGVQFLDDRARQFIETWEVESYREQQVAKMGSNA